MTHHAPLSLSINQQPTTSLNIFLDRSNKNSKQPAPTEGYKYDKGSNPAFPKDGLAPKSKKRSGFSSFGHNADQRAAPAVKSNGIGSGVATGLAPEAPVKKTGPGFGHPSEEQKKVPIRGAVGTLKDGTPSQPPQVVADDEADLPAKSDLTMSGEELDDEEDDEEEPHTHLVSPEQHSFGEDFSTSAVVSHPAVPYDFSHLDQRSAPDVICMNGAFMSRLDSSTMMGVRQSFSTSFDFIDVGDDPNDNSDEEEQEGQYSDPQANLQQRQEQQQQNQQRQQSQRQGQHPQHSQRQGQHPQQSQRQGQQFQGQHPPQQQRQGQHPQQNQRQGQHPQQRQPQRQQFQGQHPPQQQRQVQHPQQNQRQQNQRQQNQPQGQYDQRQEQHPQQNQRQGQQRQGQNPQDVNNGPASSKGQVIKEYPPAPRQQAGQRQDPRDFQPQQRREDFSSPQQQQRRSNALPPAPRSNDPSGGKYDQTVSGLRGSFPPAHQRQDDRQNSGFGYPNGGDQMRGGFPRSHQQRRSVAPQNRGPGPIATPARGGLNGAYMSEYEFEKMINQSQSQFNDFNQSYPQQRNSVQRSFANNPFGGPGFGHNGQRQQDSRYARPPSRGPSYRDATSSFGPVVSGYGGRNNGPSWEARDDRFARHPSPMRQAVRGPVISGFGHGNGQMWGSKGMMSDSFSNSGARQGPYQDHSPGKTSLSDAFVSNCDSRGLMPNGASF
jgi:hypothetical protein